MSLESCESWGGLVAGTGFTWEGGDQMGGDSRDTPWHFLTFPIQQMPLHGISWCIFKDTRISLTDRATFHRNFAWRVFKCWSNYQHLQKLQAGALGLFRALRRNLTSSFCKRISYRTLTSCLRMSAEKLLSEMASRAARQTVTRSWMSKLSTTNSEAFLVKNLVRKQGWMEPRLSGNNRGLVYGVGCHEIFTVDSVIMAEIHDLYMHHSH